MPANKGVEILPNQKVPLTNQLELKKLRNAFFKEYCPDTLPNDALLIKALRGLPLNEVVFYEACRNPTKSQLLVNVASRIAAVTKCKRVFRGPDQKNKDYSSPKSVFAQGTGANKSAWRKK